MEDLNVYFKGMKKVFGRSLVAHVGGYVRMPLKLQIFYSIINLFICLRHSDGFDSLRFINRGFFLPCCV